MARVCSNNLDTDKLAREGTSQEERFPAALDPAYAPVNEQNIPHGIVFAQQYAAMLNYFETTNSEEGDWAAFFSQDIAAQLALVAIEDIEDYKLAIKTWFDYLNNRENLAQHDLLKENLGFLYSALGSLAAQLDKFKESLPVEISLKGMLQNLVKIQLAPALKRLIGYYNGGKKLHLVMEATPSSILIIRSPVQTLESVLNSGLSDDWNIGSDWSAIECEESVYGDKLNHPDLPSSEDIFIQINHCATHTLFKSVFDQFLKVFSRVISEAGRTLDETLTKWDKHEPHYALFLAFLRLLEYARSEANSLTGRHLDFYFRDVLHICEKPAVPGELHLLVELAKHATSHEFKSGDLFKAGKDDLGQNAFFANESDVVINQARVVGLKTIYRHVDPISIGRITEKRSALTRLKLSSFLEQVNVDHRRIYASPVANSADGEGAPLISPDQSWHPFFIKGEDDAILMPKAEIGFAVASHYFLMAEGIRTITLELHLNSSLSEFVEDKKSHILCSLTTAKGWLEKVPSQFSCDGSATITLKVELGGADPAITSCSTKTHGYNFDTSLPVMTVKLTHPEKSSYLYPLLQDVFVKSIDVKVEVTGLKTFALSNDFGQIDLSKPFQPFGPMPEAGSALIMGSKEVFQKQLSELNVTIAWTVAAKPFETEPQIQAALLNEGKWKKLDSLSGLDTEKITIFLPQTDVSPTPDFSANEYFSTSARQGFVKLSLTESFGFSRYQAALNSYLLEQIRNSVKLSETQRSSIEKLPDKIQSSIEMPGEQYDSIKKLISDIVSEQPEPLPPVAPVAPTIGSLTLDYSAGTTLPLGSGLTEELRFFHLAPFGEAEQDFSEANTPFLLPQFTFEQDKKQKKSEAEFYIGIAGLIPPQNLSLLFQVVDGTANPMAENPEINWSYLKENEWIKFEEHEVQDGTDGLLNSGIMIFAVPEEATENNTILPGGMIWIRAALSENSDAVCRLQLVAAQALKATFVDKGNSPNFPATPLASGTISKLVQPEATVKTISQPFTSFGGRSVELTQAFNTRISERLRHKDRALSMWDYERLILEAFPQIYKVKCLNHTHYEEGIYRELAAGHVTILTIPNLQLQHLRDPLKPFTSLGLLSEVELFMSKRISCFTLLHVRNPQFEELRVTFNLRLREGFDETFYPKLLTESITRYLSPWAFASGSAPSFAGKVYKSSLINFIEEQPCVDYITDFKLFRDDTEVLSDAAEGSLSVSVLVSVPADFHIITLIQATSATVSGNTCESEA